MSSSTSNKSKPFLHDVTGNERLYFWVLHAHARDRKIWSGEPNNYWLYELYQRIYVRTRRLYQTEHITPTRTMALHISNLRPLQSDPWGDLRAILAIPAMMYESFLVLDCFHFKLDEFFYVTCFMCKSIEWLLSLIICFITVRPEKLNRDLWKTGLYAPRVVPTRYGVHLKT